MYQFFMYLKFLIFVKNLSLPCLSRSFMTLHFTFKFMSYLTMYTEDDKPPIRGFIIGIQMRFYSQCNMPYYDINCANLYDYINICIKHDSIQYSL